jgi:hypothetical protein
MRGASYIRAMIEFEGRVDDALLQRIGNAAPRNRVLLIIGGLLLVAGVVGFIMQPPPLDMRRHGLAIFVALLGGYYLTRATMKPNLRTPLNEPMNGAASEERLTLHRTDETEHVPWTSFSRALVRDEYVLLYRSQFFIYVFANTFFRDAASWDEFRAIVGRHVQADRVETVPRVVIALVLWLAIIAAVVFARLYFTRSG